VDAVNTVSRRTEVAARAAGLADPLRLAVLEMLSAAGPRTASEIALALGVSASRLGNHLAKLREARLVTVTRHSRQAVYELSGPQVSAVLTALDALPGIPSASASADGPGDETAAALARARTCYGHLAGRVGVGLFDHLVARGALTVGDDPMAGVEIRPDAAPVLAEWGVDPAALEPGRRRLAYPCLDWSEHRPHLGGVLADALLAGMLDRGLLAHRAGTRAMDITPRGERELLPLAGSA
jgi:DNA-binding transcriptional ArsR family regulator